MLGGTVSSIAHAVLFPSAKTDKTVQLLSEFQFPATVPLEGWQQVNTQSLQNPKKPKAKGQRYQYRQNQERLDIEAYYEPYTEGNVSRLLNLHAGIKPATVLLALKQQQGVGFYSVFNYQDRAYLSACLNSLGNTTVTGQQFVQNKYQHGWSLQRTFFWMLGHQDLLGVRCLWTLLSTPAPANAESTSLDTTYQRLETAWLNWYRWWKPRLPDS
jgi:cyanosortase A-associated protein